METHQLTSWPDFRTLINEIRARFARSTVLFRGQADSDWPLKTTLERRTEKRFDVLSYLNTATSCVNELESFTGKRWNTLSYPELKKEIESVQDSMRVYLPCYDYLVYLRHHGFPSPLLDWTSSPFVAAYFAYRDHVDKEKATVYAFIETTGSGKSKQGGRPMISVQGPYVTTDARHFAQMAQYSIATEWCLDRNRHFFCPHEGVFGTTDGNQDVLIKIMIPRSDRLSALAELSDYNISEFTLFQTEDSLVRALAMSQFDLRAG
jgi:hypothetical protein